MRFARNGNVVPDRLGASRREMRRHGRVACQGVVCSVGEVLDLSASGLRVLTRYRLPEQGEVFVVTIYTMQGPLALLGRVRWSRRKGIFLREAGIEFFDLGPKSRQVLAELAGRVAYNETFAGNKTVG